MLVLVCLLGLSVLVFKAAEITALQSRSASLLALEYRTGILARTGLDIALKLLMSKDDDEVPITQRMWAEIRQDRGLTITIRPCTAGIDINGLRSTKENRQRIEAAMLSLLEQKGLSRQELDHLLYWLGALELPPQSRGANPFEDHYARNDFPYSPPKRPLTRPEELLLVAGFEGLDAQWVREHFTVWGEAAKIDIHFTSRETALALVPELEPYWSRIESQRAVHGISHPNDLLNKVGMDMETYSTVLRHLSFQWTQFEIIVEAREGAWYEKHRYIVMVDGLGASTPPKVLVRDVLEARPL